MGKEEEEGEKEVLRKSSQVLKQRTDLGSTAVPNGAEVIPLGQYVIRFLMTVTPRTELMPSGLPKLGRIICKGITKSVFAVLG